MGLKALKALEEFIVVALPNLGAPTAGAAAERKVTVIVVENMAWFPWPCRSSSCVADPGWVNALQALGP